MAITALEYRRGRKIDELKEEVALAIADGLTPHGDPQFINGLYIQTMVEGSAIGTFEDLETRVGDAETAITAAEGDIDDLEAHNMNASAAFASDGAITTTSGVKRLTKAGVGAYTLAAPSGTEIIQIINTTANAHVVTATDLIHDGVTGGAKDTATFAAFPGSSLTLRAISNLWYVVANNNVTIAGA